MRLTPTQRRCRALGKEIQRQRAMDAGRPLAAYDCIFGRLVIAALRLRMLALLSAIDTAAASGGAAEQEQT